MNSSSGHAVVSGVHKVVAGLGARAFLQLERDSALVGLAQFEAVVRLEFRLVGCIVQLEHALAQTVTEFPALKFAPSIDINFPRLQNQ